MLKNRTFICNSTIFAMIVYLLLVPGAATGQTVVNAPQQQAVMKIEESTHKLTQENQETKLMIVSKVYDTQDPIGNSYLLRVNGGNKAVVIDPGYNYEAIVKYLGGLMVDVEAILLTNGNFIRIAGNEELRKTWPNAAILVGEQDAGLLTDPKANMSSEFGGVTSPIANVWLKDGDTFEIAGIPISVIGTPGFSPGSMTYVLPTDSGTIAFTGDFIYKEGISNASMPSSNEADLHKSLDHFLETQFAETLVFPGHGENTSLSEFYQRMTGRSVSVIADNRSQAGNSPIIIVERDPATAVLAQPVYVPTVEYRTETIYVERYNRPWVSLGVGVPFRSSWYRPWDDYYYYRPVPLPLYTYRPYPGWSLYFGWSNNSGYGWYNSPGGYYPPPLIAPPRPGRPVYPPGFVPPVSGNRPSGFPPVRPEQRPDMFPPRPNDGGPNRPRPGVIPTLPGRRPDPPTQPPGGRPGMTPITPGIRPVPGTLPNDRPVPGTRPGSPAPSNTRPAPGILPNDRPVLGTRPAPAQPAPSNTRPAPGTLPNDRPVPGTRPGSLAPPAPSNTRPAPGTLPNDRPVPGTRPAPAQPTPSNTRPAPETRSSGGSPAQPTSSSTRPVPAVQPSARPTAVTRPAAQPATQSSSAAARPAAQPAARYPSTTTRPSAQPAARSSSATTRPVAQPAARSPSTTTRPSAQPAARSSSTAARLAAQPTAQSSSTATRPSAQPAARTERPSASDTQFTATTRGRTR